ncbi:MAG: ATP-binding protein [Thermovirgaceae bacterium]
MRTLKGRMTDLVAMVLALALLAGWFVVGNGIEEHMHRQARTSLLDQMELLAGVLGETGLDGFSNVLRNVEPETGTRVTVINMSGRVLFDTQADPTTMDNHASRPEIRESMLTGTGISSRYSRSLGEEQLYIARLATDPRGDTMILRASVSLRYIQEAVNAARTRLLFSLFFAGGAAMAAGLILLRQVTKPLEELTRAAFNLQEGQKPRFPSSGTLEVQRLASALEDMSNRLEGAMGDLRREKGYFRFLLESLPVGVLVVDDGGRIRYANSALSSLLRDVPEKIEGTPYLSAIKAPELLELLEKAYKGRSGRAVFSVRGVEEKFLEAQVIKIDWGVLAVLNDLTDRMRLEQSRKAFVADAGHELQTPLTAIRAAAELLADDKDLDSEKRRSIAGKILTQQERMTALVDDLLLLSRLESEVPSEEPREIDLAGLLDSLVENILASPQAESIEVERDIAGPAVVSGRPGDLWRAFGNILDNAVKYTKKRFGDKPGGKIRVTLGPSGDSWDVIIEDNGIGVPPQAKEIIFERFQRAETDRSREGLPSGGYGLGLAIARRIFEAHGGAITLGDSAEGARFTIRLPGSSSSR